jgi:BirA family biotin operon repressor/biotin-[acetyl-CoA-carboxylase] ligase
MPDALSLAVGLGLVRAVAELGVVDPRVKWPNDIFCDGRKLAGVLIDLQPGQLQSAVIGVGINLGLPPGLPSDIAAVSVGLNTLLPQKLSRESLLALVLKHLARVLDQYEREGFAALREEWQTAHALQDRAVNVSGAEYLNGICSGVGERGELLVQTAEGLRRVLSGDVSLRPA